MAEDTPQNQKNLSAVNIYENIVQLRRQLGLSQKEFVERFLKGPDGAPLCSAGTFSNMEHGKGPFVHTAARAVADVLGADPRVFEMDPDSFFKNLDIILEPYRKEQGRDLPCELPAGGGSTQSLVRILSDYLSDGLMSGELHPRDKLPSDRSLAQRFGVGRSTVREALRVLSLIGLIETRPGQGSFIAENSSDFFLAPLSWSFLLGKKSIDDMNVLRALLETGTARMAAQLAQPGDLQELSQVMERMKEAYARYDFKDFLELDVDFHLTIARCAKNPIIYDLLRTSRKLLALISHSGMTTVEHLDCIYQEHTDIYEAVKARDGQRAADAMQRHLQTALGRYRPR